MGNRMFRQYVFCLVAAGGTSEVVDVSGIMQDIAPKKGFKLHALWYQLVVGAALEADGSSMYFNVLKNISEAAHHVTPGSAGEVGDARTSGTILSEFTIFDALPGGRVTNWRYWPFYEKPIEFDANDRLNLEITVKNEDAAQGDGSVRLFLDVEVL